MEVGYYSGTERERGHLATLTVRSESNFLKAEVPSDKYMTSDTLAKAFSGLGQRILMYKRFSDARMSV